ncbi:chromosome partitioning protein ParA [Candidatus Poribacteria bacterium]|nr:MAG: chromosome partitioning protein ParA [Candidatus Poribacteria bacterium]
MKTIAIMSRKGGTGKTTLATHISVAAEKAGHTPILIDLDPQASAAKWGDYRDAESPAIIATPASRVQQWLKTAKDNGATLAILDTPPNAGHDALDVANAANLVLIPCKPSIMDLDAIASTLSICEIAKVSAHIVLNSVPARTTLGNQARTALPGQCAPCEFGHRVAFVHALNHGLTAQEYLPKSKASIEAQVLYEYVEKQLEV